MPTQINRKARSVGVYGTLGVLALGLLAGGASGAIVWDESIFGDFSGVRQVPSQVPVLSEGINSIIASVDESDKDYFTITVPAGLVLSGLVLESYEGDDQIAFFAMQRGSTFTEDPDFPNVRNILGMCFLGPATGNVGADLFADLREGLGQPVQGFQGSLAAGQYTFWLQQLGPLTTVQLDFVLTVPGPGAGLAGMGGAMCWLGVSGFGRPQRRSKAGLRTRSNVRD